MNPATNVRSVGAARSARWTVDELARRSGLTTRTIRAHQSAGLLPRPHLDGRTGYYERAHLERLGAITRLQGRGYSLAAIADLLQASDDGRTLSDVLGLARSAPTAEPVERKQTTDWVDELFTAFVTPNGPAPVLPAGILN